VEPTEVLLIEDNPGDAYLVEHALREARPGAFRLTWTDRLSSGLAALEERDGTAVVLLDLHLPDAQGLSTLHRLRRGSSRRPAVIVLTGTEDEALGVEAVAAGAQDYLTKARLDGDTLARAIAYSIARHRNEERLAVAALRDDLTGLRNRRAFFELARHRALLAERSGRPLSVLFVDVDGLKDVNDRLGHAEGSRLIRDAAGILAATVRRSDVVARLGGDEFVVLLDETSAGAVRLAERIRERVRAFNERRDRPYQLSLSIGAATLHPADHRRIEDLLVEADRRMYEDKRRRGRLRQAADGGPARSA
jgi:diguanylate cyclase (GGDEF)-like protein